MASTGQLFVLSGPSGVGKSSLREQALQMLPGLEYSISHTTRPPRHGEMDGKDYHFVSLETFLSRKEAGAFVEWARVHGTYYGTSREHLDGHLNKHRDVLLEIDVQGARQVKRYYPKACFIFVLPPDRETLEKRLLERGTEPGADIETRLENASRELLEASWYDYLVINDDLEKAVESLAAIILSARCRREVILPRVESLLQKQ